MYVPLGSCAPSRPEHLLFYPPLYALDVFLVGGLNIGCRVVGCCHKGMWNQSALVQTVSTFFFYSSTPHTIVLPPTCSFSWFIWPNSFRQLYIHHQIKRAPSYLPPLFTCPFPNGGWVIMMVVHVCDIITLFCPLCAWVCYAVMYLVRKGKKGLKG